MFLMKYFLDCIPVNSVSQSGRHRLYIVLTLDISSVYNELYTYLLPVPLCLSPLLIFFSRLLLSLQYALPVLWLVSGPVPVTSVDSGEGAIWVASPCVCIGVVSVVLVLGDCIIPATFCPLYIGVFVLNTPAFCPQHTWGLDFVFLRGKF